MITSSGCVISEIVPQIPTQYDMLRRDLMSPTDRMVDDTRRRLEHEWVDPKFTEDQTPVFSFEPPPTLLPIDIRADVPPFPYKDDSEYHFADVPLKPTPLLDPLPRRRYGRYADDL